MEKTRLAKLAAYAAAMGYRWLDANQKVAIFSGLHSEELRHRLGRSHGAIAYDVLARTLLFDLIRDVWAFTLDDDTRAPSVADLWQKFGSVEVRSALREQFDDSGTLKDWFPAAVPAAERARRMNAARLDRKAVAYEAFDIAFRFLDREVPAALNSERAERISKTRNRAIARYNMRQTGGEYAVFDPSTTGLEWEDPARFLADIRPIVLELTGLVARAGFDIPEFERVHRHAADDSWSRLLGEGPVELMTPTRDS
jgi:hypothetical protein